MGLITITRICVALLCLMLTATQLLHSEEMRETNALPTSALLTLKRGLSLEEVKYRLKTSAIHQFTIGRGSNVQCVSVEFAWPRGTLYFLFEEDRLVSITDPPPIEWESKSFRGRPWKVPKAFKAERKAEAILKQKDLTAEQITARLQMWAEADQQTQGEPGNISPAFILTAPLWASKSKEIRESLAQATELTNRFNPLKIRLGMTLDEVRRHFGKPVKCVECESGSKAYIFGAVLPSYTPANFPQVWLSVIIKDGKVEAVYSHDFFDKSLLSN